MEKQDDITTALARLRIEEPDTTTNDPAASLDTLPPEIIIEILGNIKWKRDWLVVARVCRRLANVAISELYRNDRNTGAYFALWHACQAYNQAAILNIFRRILAEDPETANWVNRHFTASLRASYILAGPGMTPLNLAVALGSEQMVEMLLAHGADPGLPDRELYHDALPYPINHAVRRTSPKSVEVLCRLLLAGAKPDQEPMIMREEDRRLPSMLPHGQLIPIFRVLSLTESVSGYAASMATYNKELADILDFRKRQLEVLLGARANTSLRQRHYGSKPVFFLLARLGHYEPAYYTRYNYYQALTSDDEDIQCRMVSEKAGALLATLSPFVDINELDVPCLSPYYRDVSSLATSEAAGTPPVTPLHFACTLADRVKPVIRWLLENGASINARDGIGRTPLMAYCGAKFSDMDEFERFLTAGADVNVQCDRGFTALHALSLNGSISIGVKRRAMEILVRRRADPRIMDNAGRRPVDLFSDSDWDASAEPMNVLLRAAARRYAEDRRRRQAGPRYAGPRHRGRRHCVRRANSHANGNS